VNLAASPSQGYEFEKWLGAPVNGVTNPETVIDMQDNYEITAQFKAIAPTYKLNMAVFPPAVEQLPTKQMPVPTLKGH